MTMMQWRGRKLEIVWNVTNLYNSEPTNWRTLKCMSECCSATSWSLSPASSATNNSPFVPGLKMSLYIAVNNPEHALLHYSRTIHVLWEGGSERILRNVIAGAASGHEAELWVYCNKMFVLKQFLTNKQVAVSDQNMIWRQTPTIHCW